MFKQVIVILVLSILIIFFMPYAQQVLQYLIDAHDWIAQVLMDVFSGGQAGNIVRNLIALLSVPVLIGFIPAIFYWAVKRHLFPYFMEIVWIVWLIEVSALIMVYKG